MDQETKQLLYQLSDILEDAVDNLAAKRDSCDGKDKYDYRYTCKKVQQAAINIRLAIDKVTATV